jgi:two-component system, NarL family, sensor histidine kinase UhpB
MSTRRRLPPRQALFWRVFWTNAAVLTAACAITVLVLSPGVISSGVALAELLVLAGGIGAMLVLNLVLARRAFAPLRDLTSFAHEVDPLAPGPRAAVSGAPSEATELAAAFNEMLDRLADERRDSVGRALAAQEGERLRVAQELHDEVGQTLTSVVLQLGRTAKRVPEPYRDELTDAQETARASLEEVRRIALQLRPEALDDLGLATALRVLGERVGEDRAVTIEVHVAEPLPALTPEEELVLYRVAQEALTNAVRHADPARAQVRVEQRDGRLELVVSDDGRGVGSAAEGGGIRGMRERAVLISARLDVSEPPQGGTHVRLTLPLDADPP